MRLELPQTAVTTLRPAYRRNSSINEKEVVQPGMQKMRTKRSTQGCLEKMIYIKVVYAAYAARRNEISCC
jgi:hypothetical protein